MQLDHDNPWPGLESFEEDAHEYFFGRDNEIKLLREHVLDSPVTVFYGRSGLGKTSLLRAGLFPVLRDRDFLPIYVRLDLKTGAPLTHQLERAVRDAIAEAVPDATPLSDQQSLWEYLHRNDLELWSARNYPLTPVIVLDQFEELFTLGEKFPDLIAQFRNAFGDLAENRIPAELAARIDCDEAVASQFNLRSRNYKLLVSLREDYLPELEGWCRLIPTLARSRVRLLRLRTSEAIDAVHEPAADMMSYELARLVVGHIAGENLHPGQLRPSPEVALSNNDFAVAEVEPPLLSLFCRELNEERKRRGQVRFDEKLVEDAKHETLNNYYSSCVSDLDPRVARFIESELITESGYRDSYIREDAVPSRLTEVELDRLISSRLVRLEDRDGAPRIELTHDVLTTAVRDHRDRRRVEEEKAELEAEKQRQQEQVRAAQERQQVAENYATVLRKRSRVLHAVLVGTVIIAVAAIVAAVVAVQARDQATAAKHQADMQRRAAEANSRKALGESLSSEGQAILAGKQPGSELEALVKIIAAQHISPAPQLGGLLVALGTEPRLQAIYPTSGVLSGDGQRVGDSNSAGLQMVDTRTGHPVGRPFTELQWLRTGLSFTGRYLASFNYHTDKTIRVWDFDEGRYLGQPMQGTENYALNVAVSSDGRRVAAEDTEGSVRLWDTETGHLIDTLRIGRDSWVGALEFSPDGRILATGGDEGTVRLWDAQTGRALRETTRATDERMEGTDSILSLAFSPDGSAIAAGGKTVGLSSVSGGSPLRIWNTATGELIGTPIVGDYGSIKSLAFSPDGRRIATGSDDKTVRLWDAGTGQPVGDPLSFQSAVWQIAFTRAGNSIVAVSGDAVQTLNADPEAHLPVETRGSKVAALGPDERYGADTQTDVPQIVLLRENSLLRLNADTGAQTGVVVSEALRSLEDEESSRDNRWMAIAGNDNVIRVVDTSNGEFVGKPMTGHTDHINDMEFSPNGQTLASASDDDTVRLWNWRTGEQIGAPLKEHKYGVDTVTFSEDGGHLFSRGGGSVLIWDLTTQPPKWKQIAGPDSPLFVTADAVSPDGRHIATGSDFGGIQQWDVDSGDKHGREMQGHNDEINDMSYSPDGKYLVSAGMRGTDDTLRFWDTASGRQIGEPVSTEYMGQATYVSFSKDGHWVYVVAQGVTLNGGGPTAGHNAVWRLPAPVEWEHALCEKLRQNPNDDQWKNWVSAEIPYTELCPGKPRAS